MAKLNYEEVCAQNVALQARIDALEAAKAAPKTSPKTARPNPHQDGPAVVMDGGNALLLQFLSSELAASRAREAQAEADLRARDREEMQAMRQALQTKAEEPRANPVPWGAIIREGVGIVAPLLGLGGSAPPSSIDGDEYGDDDDEGWEYVDEHGNPVDPPEAVDG